MQLEKRYLFKSEVARNLRIPVATVNSWIESGQLKVIVINDQVRIEENELKDFLDNKVVAVSAQIRNSDKAQHYKPLIKLFVEKCCQENETSVITSADLYKKYLQWSQENEKFILGKNQFGKILGLIGYSKVRGDGGKRMWKGIRLNFFMRNLTGDV